MKDSFQPTFRVEKITPESKAIDGLEMIYERLGKPEWDIKSQAFWAFFGQVLNVWSKFFPDEYRDWLKDLKVDLAVERSLGASVKSGLKKSMAFPTRVYHMLKIYFPNMQSTNKEFIQKAIRKFPILHNSNYT
jgi:hypothetical protein